LSTYLVTGGAGFIGSNIVAGIAASFPESRIVVCDVFGTTEKWRNLSHTPVDEVIAPNEVFYWLETNSDELEAIIHMGAISSTTEIDADLILEQNVTFSKLLRMWAQQAESRFIYASSGSVYGDGSQGFEDGVSTEYHRKLKPLNGYAWSKWLFDYHVMRSVERGEPQPKQWAGLRFFNVYGPNEYHKQEQQSVIARVYPQAKAHRPVKLFKSYNEQYPDGGQLRDFIYVKDCVNVVLWLLKNPGTSGIFNVGTGKARSFDDLAKSLFAALGQPPEIQYIEMPREIRGKYQYFTEANMQRLADEGYSQPFHSLEDGVKEYVQAYLEQDDPYR
jgi:ADP-L-glycero-D-manno-heptose 6-epimerase